MWFEILPSMGIIFTFMALPHVGSYVGNRLIIGNHFQRRVDTTEQVRQYFRDSRLTGNPYKVQGLEAIPDA